MSASASEASASDGTESSTGDTESGSDATTDGVSAGTDSDPGGCAGPGDCPQPPGDCVQASCEGGECGVAVAPEATPCSGGVCDAGGSCVECLADLDCPSPPGECLLATCAAGLCEPGALAEGTPCGGGVCDAGGSCVECVAAADCPSPPGECLQATCAGGACGAGTVAAGTPCGGGVCDAGGGCVECIVDADCPGEVCQAGLCVAPPPSCGDGLKNGSETDIDCGGACPGCADGEACVVDGDCSGGDCEGLVCSPPGPACAQQPADPLTGQRCPLFMSCSASSECGDLVGCQQWFCNGANTCELNAKVACWTDVGGACNADVVLTQHTLPPVDKRFVPPDGVNFREVASLAFTVKNNTAGDLYLDKLPLALELMGNASKFDVSSVKIFDNSGGTEHGLGDLLVCLTADPFSFPANGVMGPCGGSPFARIPKGQSNQFVVNVAFAANKTFIAGRSYRLRLASTAGIELRVGLNGPKFAGSMCGVPGPGFTGAWVTAQQP